MDLKKIKGKIFPEEKMAALPAHVSNFMTLQAAGSAVVILLGIMFSIYLLKPKLILITMAVVAVSNIYLFSEKVAPYLYGDIKVIEGEVVNSVNVMNVAIVREVRRGSLSIRDDRGNYYTFPVLSDESVFPVGTHVRVYVQAGSETMISEKNFRLPEALQVIALDVTSSK